MVTKNSLIKQTIICVFLTVIILLIETYTNIDLSFQRLFFDTNTSEWLINNKIHKLLTYAFYDGYKIILAFIALLKLIQIVKGYKSLDKNDFRNNLLFILALSLIPLVISGLKAVTNIYCPYQIKEFGGEYVYQRVLEPANLSNVIDSEHQRGQGFPAGHASGGFALMILFYIFKKKNCWYGLLIGQIVGWVTGMYQVLRGKHFISHNFITMLIAWQIIITLVYFIDKKLQSSEPRFLPKTK